MTMSSVSAGSTFSSVTWIALTVIEDVVAVLLTICSLSTTVATPGIEMVVFGAGAEPTRIPLTNAFRSVVEPVDPVAVEVQSLETTVAVTRLDPTTGFATDAVLCELPLAPTTPWVLTFRTPVVRTPGRFTLASEAVSGPPPLAGNVTVGVGPTLAGPVTWAPNALPLTVDTSTALGADVAAGALPAKPPVASATAVRIMAANPRPNRFFGTRYLESSILTPFLADQGVSSTRLLRLFGWGRTLRSPRRDARRAESPKCCPPSMGRLG
jgi:hypothetical protein